MMVAIDKQNSRRMNPLGAILLAVHLAAILAYVHLKYIDEPTLSDKIEQHRTFLAGKALYPYQYRVFLHLACEAFLRASSSFLAYEKSFLFFQVGVVFSTTAASLLLFYRYLKIWFPDASALFGMTFLAAIHPLSFFNYHFQPSSSLILAIYIVGMLSIYYDQWIWLILCIAVASLERFEAAFFLISMYFLCADKRTGRFWLFFALYVLIGIGAAAGLRWYFGPQPYVHSAAFHLSYNFRTPGTLLLAVLYGPFWLWALLGFASAPKFLRRILLIVPIFVLLHFFVAKVNEVRLFLPLAPILIPLGFGYWFGWKQNNDE
ncbi:MAG: hypothetical protein AB1656_21655 [Candidatus Omnitrophota bacterium]